MLNLDVVTPRPVTIHEDHVLGFPGRLASACPGPGQPTRSDSGINCAMNTPTTPPTQPTTPLITTRAQRRAIMFDLDGTLVDSLADTAAAGNHAIAQLGCKPIESNRYRYLAGQGLEYLIQHALGPGREADIPAGMAAFKAYYKDHDLDHTRPYAGLPEVLDQLVSQGDLLAVLSNKPHLATVALVEKVFGRWPFLAVRGAMDGLPLKPDPAGALAILAETGIPAERWVYVGDTRVDMETACRAGLPAVGVTWGFRDEPELRDAGASRIIHHPHELPAAIDALRPA